jgi:transcriptional regulator with XRE-family HTH domain
MDEDFIRERITQLRLQKKISEYRMSYDLGHSRGYVYNISSGKSLPPMREFLAICDYFDITPSAFFDESKSYPGLIQKSVEGMQELNDVDLLLILEIIERLRERKG